MGALSAGIPLVWARTLVNLEESSKLVDFHSAIQDVAAFETEMKVACLSLSKLDVVVVIARLGSKKDTVLENSMTSPF